MLGLEELAVEGLHIYNLTTVILRQTLTWAFTFLYTITTLFRLGLAAIYSFNICLLGFLRSFQLCTSFFSSLSLSFYFHDR